ncbi:TerB family tellurite resistance protein [Candidatus Pelagibacter sp.]|nr:TerB family tellurite resistance protein [Candidatus Pelagibacter sp.]
MFFNKKKESDLIKVSALLIHAAKIDQNYSPQEQKIIEQALKKFGADNENLDEILKKAEEIENNSVQILEYTKEIKSMNQENKVKIIETLWRIIYSNKEADMYETNLMRRLGGLLYIDSKLMGDIKNKIKSEIL